MEIVNVAYLGSDGQYQDYKPSDKSLINSTFITPTFGNPNDYVEYFIKDQGGTILSSNYFDTRYNVGRDITNTTGATSTLYLDPEKDVRDAGYNRGVVNIKYNFFRTYLLSAPALQQNFWIKEISTTRTEIKVARQDLSNAQLQSTFLDFNAALSADTYYPDFLLNFGADEQILAVNAVYVEEDGNGYLIFKLYEPLPTTYDLKSTFWVVDAIADPAEFNVSINVEPETIQDSFRIKGPNYKVTVNNTVGQTTPYYSYQSLLNTAVTSSYQQLKSMMDEKGITINVDYSNFSNFVHFSSITDRLNNFTYKIGLIEAATAGLAQTNTATAKVALQATIDNIIAKFDGYEYYLYYSSGSTAWPKQNSTQPYQLYSTTSPQVLDWLGSETTVPTGNKMSMLYSASLYDNANQDLLQYSTPAYLREDDNNQPYMTFLNMIGQHFDNIWIYLKDVSNRFSAENNPFVGISMDQVADALRGFGIQLYTNTSISDNIYYSLFGINPNGTLQPPTGSEKITTYVTSSIKTLPGTQITNEYYKRLYHNLAYLLKTRGTERGIRALVTTFGIPNEVLQVHEYGGYRIDEVAGIQEIAKDKVIIPTGVQQINTDLLSPNATLQYYNNDIMKSSINVEVGFSPADSINASITSSALITSSAQPGYFNIMQYIGDPALQYSSSYTPLVQLSNKYFSSSYDSRYNVWDFIRVIKYYNNSLFKMLRDWVPARSSATTGIIIKSHMLERNKYPRHEPTYTTSSNDANYELLTIDASDGGAINGSTAYTQSIPIQYSIYSAPLSGSFGTVQVLSSDGIQKYTGEFSGSTIQATTNYFNQDEVTTYNYPTTSSIPGPVAVMFATYSLGAVYQNVTASVISQRYLDLDYNGSQLAPVNLDLILQSLSQSLVIGPISQSQQPYSEYAELQDFNYNQRASVQQKYSGSTLIGQKYNVYSIGDRSYGNDPVIDYYTNKLGLFTQVFTSSFLPGKVNASLAYLADVSGGLFELNQNNKHWVDVQNTMKEGSSVTIKQFDNRKFSNQKPTDGPKIVYSSGYSYTPQLYFKSGSDNTMYFQYAGSGNDELFIARNTDNPNNELGYGGQHYIIDGGPGGSFDYFPVYNLFDYAEVGGEYYTPGSTAGNTYPTYRQTQPGIKRFRGKIGIDVAFNTTSQVMACEFRVKKNGTSIAIQGTVNGIPNSPQSVLTGYVYSFETTGTPSYIARAVLPGATALFPTGPQLTLPGPFNVAITTPAGVCIQCPAATGVGTTADYIKIQKFNVIGDPAGTVRWGIVERSPGLDAYPNFFPYYNTTPTGPGASFLTSHVIGVLPVSVDGGPIVVDFYTEPVSLQLGDEVTFEYKIASSTSDFYAEVDTINNNILTVETTGLLGSGFYTSATGSTIPFIEDISLTQTPNPPGFNITLNSSLSQYYLYQFIPYFESASVIYSSSLYTTYGEVNTAFEPQVGDAVVLFDRSGNSQILDVIQNSYISSSRLQIPVESNLLQNWVNDPNLISQFLLVRRYKDEQNVIMTFNKPPGETSYGFLIPEGTNPEVLAKINTLQASVQSQLVQFQGTTG